METNDGKYAPGPVIQVVTGSYRGTDGYEKWGRRWICLSLVLKRVQINCMFKDNVNMSYLSACNVKQLIILTKFAG